MKKALFLLIALAFTIVSAVAQNTYHEDDKEGLRAFLRQPSAIEGMINAKNLRLTLSDTLTWYEDEAWVAKIPKLGWNNDTLKRLVSIHWGNTGYPMYYSYDLAGELDATKWRELTTLYCWDNHLTSIDVGENAKLKELGCTNNELTTLNLGGAIELTTLYCYENQLTNLNVTNNINLEVIACDDNYLTILDLSNNMNLQDFTCAVNQLDSLIIANEYPEIRRFFCDYNSLSLSNLFAITEILNDTTRKSLTPQYLPAQNTTIGVPLFADQSIFNEVFTEYGVFQNGSVAPVSSYAIVDGTLTFNEDGVYTVTMTNAAISGSPNVIVKITVGDVGIDENESMNITVYPNPTTGELRVENGESIVENVDFFNIYGQKCHSQHGSILNISHLPAGVYLLKINTEAGVATRKIVKL